MAISRESGKRLIVGMERVSNSQEGATLVYEQELSSGGLMKRHEERLLFRQREDEEISAG